MGRQLLFPRMKTTGSFFLWLSFAVLTARPCAAADGRNTALAFSKAEPTCDQVKVVESAGAAVPGLAVTVKPGANGYPGFILKPKSGGTWDLSGNGYLDAMVENTGKEEVRVFLRVDNEGDWKKNPWNTENAAVGPGETEKVRVYFGHSDGQKPGFPLNAAKVSQLLIFTGKTEKERSFNVAAITAGGAAGEKPPTDPDKIRTIPKGGALLGAGVPVALKKAAGARAELKGGAAVEVSFSGEGQSVTIRPEQGAWDLRDFHQVRVKLRNAGGEALAVTGRVNSWPGPTDEGKLPRPLPAGGSGELVISFLPGTPWTGDGNAHTGKDKIAAGKGTKFISDHVSGVTITSDSAGELKFVIESVNAAAPPAVLPEWLGKRPPVEGDWKMTFQEEFDGKAVNLSKWNIYTANYWDTVTHFTKDNVTLKNGTAMLRYEKKSGRHNDDPKGKELTYASGFLDTYGKWVQRYGYFEARMKLPNAPGLWPAMWLMPDRGLAKGEQWKRASTHEGGMEYDIMEWLARWGPYRFNIAFHWDGYQGDHRQTGSTCIYTDHDKDGFLTSGLLWLPGKAVMYTNGREVARWESPRVSSVPSDLMFTHVMGGWDNNELDDKRLPADFVIDYVRCWQRKDLASEADGVKATEATPAAPVK